MENKRIFPRKSVGLTVTFRKTQSYLLTGARIKDISETGMCMPSNLFYPIGHLIEIDILLDEYKISIKTKARVARLTDLTNNRYRFDVGLEFLELASQERNILREYIQRSLALEKK